MEKCTNSFGEKRAKTHQSTHLHFYEAKVSPCPRRLCKVEPRWGFRKNLHTSLRSGSILAKNLAYPDTARVLPQEIGDELTNISYYGDEKSKITQSKIDNIVA